MMKMMTNMTEEEEEEQEEEEEEEEREQAFFLLFVVDTKGDDKGTAFLKPFSRSHLEIGLSQFESLSRASPAPP